MATKKARGEVRRLLVIINSLQGQIGKAHAYHANDRDPEGFSLGQETLESALKLCVLATSAYDPVDA